MQLYVKELADAIPPITADLAQLEAKRKEVKATKAKEYQEKKDKCMDRDCCQYYFVFVLLGLPGANLSYLAADDLSKSSGQPVKAKSKDGRHALNVFGKDADLTTEGTNKGENAQLLHVIEKSTQVKSDLLQASVASEKLRTLEKLIAKLEAKPHLAQYPGELVDLEQEHMTLLRASLKPTTSLQTTTATSAATHRDFQTPSTVTTVTTVTGTTAASSLPASPPSFAAVDAVDSRGDDLLDLVLEWEPEREKTTDEELLVDDDIELPTTTGGNTPTLTAPVAAAPVEELLVVVAAATTTEVEWCRGGGKDKTKTIISTAAPPRIVKKRPPQQEQAGATTKSSGRSAKRKVICEAGESQLEFCSHYYKINTRSCPDCFKV